MNGLYCILYIHISFIHPIHPSIHIRVNCLCMFAIAEAPAVSFSTFIIPYHSAHNTKSTESMRLPRVFYVLCDIVYYSCVLFLYRCVCCYTYFLLFNKSLVRERDREKETETETEIHNETMLKVVRVLLQQHAWWRKFNCGKHSLSSVATFFTCLYARKI